MVSSQQPPSVVMVADDDTLIRSVLRLALTTRGHEVIEAKDAIEARTLGSEFAVDVVVLDVNMPGGGVDQTVAELRATKPGVPILLLSGDPRPPAGLVLDSIDFAQKPIDLGDFLDRIDRLLLDAHAIG